MSMVYIPLAKVLQKEGTVILEREEANIRSLLKKVSSNNSQTITD